jgi:hypothetical protein
MARGDAEALKAAGFKDDHSKKDEEELRLVLDLVPTWTPGESMRPPKPAGMKMVTPKGKKKAEG